MTVPHGFSTWKWGTFQLKLYWSVVLFYTDPFKSAQRQWWWRDHVYTHIFIVFREISLTPLMFPGTTGAGRDGGQGRMLRQWISIRESTSDSQIERTRDTAWHSVTLSRSPVTPTNTTGTHAQSDDCWKLNDANFQTWYWGQIMLILQVRSEVWKR